MDEITQLRERLALLEGRVESLSTFLATFLAGRVNAPPPPPPTPTWPPSFPPNPPQPVPIWYGAPSCSTEY